MESFFPFIYDIENQQYTEQISLYIENDLPFLEKEANTEEKRVIIIEIF